MLKISYMVVPAVTQILDGGLMFCSFLYLFESTYKNISKIKSFGVATLITKENIKT